jgi:hypothetical protein
MYRLEGNGIVNGLSRDSRIVLSITSGVAGLVMGKDFHLPNDLKGPDVGS